MPPFRRRFNRRKPVVVAIKKRRNRVTPRTVARIARNVIARKTETKYTLDEFGNATAKHDTNYFAALFATMNQGTTDQSRIGDEVHLKNLWLRLYLTSNATTSKPATWRITVVRVKKDTAPTDSQMFIGTGAFLTRFVNREYCTVLYDRLYTARNYAVNTHPEAHIKTIRIPLNCKHVFDSDNSDLGKFYNYYVCCSATVESGVTGTTDAGFYKVSALTTFKDS